MFRRRRSDDSDEPIDEATGVDELDEDVLDVELDDADGTDDADDESPTLTARTGGPFDSSEVDDDEERLDLGSLLVQPVEGVEVRLEIDEASGVVQGATLAAGATALQVGLFAAPRSEGIWAEVRAEIAKNITASGGTVDHVEGEYGAELRARVVGEDDKGNKVSQPVRFIGIDGPRWFLRGLLSGPGVDDAGAAAPVLDTFRSLVVVRGTDPMAPHEALPLRLPTDSVEGVPDEPSRPDVNPFRRGPEITEIR